jgi:hypothetical protein
MKFYRIVVALKIFAFTCYQENASRCNKFMSLINLLKTERRPLYLKAQSVPRCKHFSSRL